MQKRSVAVTGIMFFVIVLLVSLILSPLNFHTVNAVGNYYGIGTSNGLNGSNDALNFSQGRVWTIDKYGKYIWLTQNLTGPTSNWAWSNNLGANWTQGSEDYLYLIRGSVAYDSINDVLHVIWTASLNSDGIIYRRYSISRDGSHNITSIQRMDSGTVNLQLDVSNSNNLEQPVALWVNDGSANGSLVAAWSKNGSGISEVRASMRKLSMSAADGVAGNWTALDNSADTFNNDAPLIAADKIYSSTSGFAVTSMKVRGGTGSRKDDLYVFVAENNTHNVLAYRGIWNSTNKDWRGGFQSPITVGTGIDDTLGYNLKYQLITKPVTDIVNDRIYIGWARWKTGGAGDTASFAYLDSTDSVSSTVDVYSANGTHSYAPTLDITLDNSAPQLLVSYVESTTNGSNGNIILNFYSGTTLTSILPYYTSPGGSNGQFGSADIPIMYEDRSSDNKILFAFRVNGSLPPSGPNPHVINWGYIQFQAPTPTSVPSTNTPIPTNTPVPTATNTPLPTATSTAVPTSTLTPTTAPTETPVLKINNTIVTSGNIPTVNTVKPIISGIDKNAYKIVVESTPQTYFVTPDANGNWSIAINSDLENGNHKVTVYNNAGTVLSVSDFVVNVQGLSNTGQTIIATVAAGVFILITLFFLNHKKIKI